MGGGFKFPMIPERLVNTWIQPYLKLHPTSQTSQWVDTGRQAHWSCGSYLQLKSVNRTHPEPNTHF